VTPTCDSVRALLADFVGGDLVPAAAEGVRRHLRGCAACRNEAVGWQQARKALRGFGAAVPRAADEAMFVDLHASIVAAVAS
jgi:anti-sigma factor RsiW